jgi:hypothetical protein
MSEVGIVDRNAVIDMLVPNKTEQSELFFDHYHFNTAEPYHAMNWDLINQLIKKLELKSTAKPAGQKESSNKKAATTASKRASKSSNED